MRYPRYEGKEAARFPKLMHEYKIVLRGSKFEYIPLDPGSESRYIVALDN